MSKDDRPAVAERMNRIGVWKGDTVIGKEHEGALLTIVERKALFTLIVRLTGKRLEFLDEAAVSHMVNLKNKIKTIAFDNGLEFSGYETSAEGLEADIYFSHLYSSWERGINENTTSLIRQHFPKGTNFNIATDEQVQLVMDHLNSRPKASQGGRPPNEFFLGLQDDLLVA